MFSQKKKTKLPFHISLGLEFSKHQSAISAQGHHLGETSESSQRKVIGFYLHDTTAYHNSSIFKNISFQEMSNGLDEKARDSIKTNLFYSDTYLDYEPKFLKQ